MKHRLFPIALTLAIAAGFVWQRWTMEREALELAAQSVRYGWLNARTGESLQWTTNAHARMMHDQRCWHLLPCGK